MAGSILRNAANILSYLTSKTAWDLKNGIPLETIQMLIGHTKIATTQIYADVDEEKIINDMEGLDNKLEQNRATVLKNW